ncbi:flagellar export protein FliJ [Pannonibacter sp. Q-1]|jgi:flagellar FliJ protein|uniref:Flagellar FliJ protein n=3 Tax=Pannonibacter TaxID=227873 RepID=A0A0L0J2W0_9HYPH|nr:MULTISPECIES: flagellar export protein FliJ [Pannonibacter]MBA4205927.1 flagellar export protein FliJ [Polymorphum sp.]ALV27308.1 flagellar export protein FliJ [Pannonibacter phragmitetus]KND19780.1 flagellar export protein FliJ [Pannonibacter phragmitetus]CUA98529.1 flagellar export protein FliJ [Pannonibacter indicus]SUB02499.1 flagellar biosynthesis chaperone [Pannonibacter phragmitetus]
MKSRESLIRLKRFQVDEKRRQVTQIESMIAEFHRMADELDDQIRTEQERVGITDVTHFAYPTFAKAAATRRDNLRNSAHELDDQLEKARDELSEAIEELKKFEQLEERDHQREREAQEQAEQDQLDEVAGRVRAR